MSDADAVPRPGTPMEIGVPRTSAAGGGRGVIGAATFNAFVGLSRQEAREDALALGAIEDLDLIGWQEVNKHPPGALGLDESGWETLQPLRTSGNPHELAVSWRPSAFSLVGSEMVRMHGDSDSDRGEDRSFPARWVLQVVLRRTGRYPDLLTVLNTHVNHRIERWQTEPGVPFANTNASLAREHLAKLRAMVDASNTRYTIILGDYNWDFVADQQTREPDFVRGRIAEVAVSGWEALGVDGQPVSHPYSDRRIDYVFVTRSSPAAFLSQTVLEGWHSDHRPVVARIALD